jgi:hypothetical protein
MLIWSILGMGEPVYAYDGEISLCGLGSDKLGLVECEK